MAWIQKFDFTPSHNVKLVKLFTIARPQLSHFEMDIVIIVRTSYNCFLSNEMAHEEFSAVTGTE